MSKEGILPLKILKTERSDSTLQYSIFNILRFHPLPGGGQSRVFRIRMLHWCPSLGTMQIKRNIPLPVFLN